MSDNLTATRLIENRRLGQLEICRSGNAFSYGGHLPTTGVSQWQLLTPATASCAKQPAPRAARAAWRKVKGNLLDAPTTGSRQWLAPHN